MTLKDEVRQCIERWNSGHWEIDAAEVQALADAICELPDHGVSISAETLANLHQRNERLAECLRELLPFVKCSPLCARNRDYHERCDCGADATYSKARAILEEAANGTKVEKG